MRERKLAASNKNANSNANEQTRRAGDEIAERLLDVGAAVIKLLATLRGKAGAKNVIAQLERCGPGGGVAS